MRRKRLTNLALMHRTIMAGLLQGFGLLPTLAPRAAPTRPWSIYRILRL
jgi:hypothetical protein